MRMYIRLALVLMAATLALACSRIPSEEIQSTKEAMDGLVAAEAERYAPAAFKKATGSFELAQAEVAAQNKSIFKDYSAAVAMLRAARDEASRARSAAGAGKVKAKDDALAAFNLSKTAYQDFSAALTAIPSTKGTIEEAEALNKYMKDMEGALAGVQALIDNSEYLAAIDHATAIADKAKRYVQDCTALAAKAQQEAEAEKAAKKKKKKK